MADLGTVRGLLQLVCRVVRCLLPEKGTTLKELLQIRLKTSLGFPLAGGQGLGQQRKWL